MKLFLVRHGFTFEKGQTPVQVGSGTDIPLTSLGEAQAISFGSYLSAHNIKPAVIYSGSLKRQSRAAELILSNCKSSPPLKRNSALEEIDYGDWEGLSTQELIKNWPSEYQDWSENGVWPEEIFKDTESSRIELFEDFLNTLLSRFESKDTVVAVSSNGIIRQIARYAHLRNSFQAFGYKADPKVEENLWTHTAKLSGIESLKVRCGSYSEIVLRWNDDSIPEAKILSWNQSP